MKLKIFTADRKSIFAPGTHACLLCGRGLVLCVLALSLATRTLACGPLPRVMPDDCDLYRLMPYYAEQHEPDDGRREANCRAWQREVGGSISLSAIDQAVYAFSLADWQRVSQGDDLGNAFCRRLLATGDSAAIRLLLWSKYYEQWSEQMRSLWYYGCGLEESTVDIDSILACCTLHSKSHHQASARLAPRYLLLAMKCLYRSGRNEECIALWGREKKAFSGSHLRNQAEGYYAACLTRTGRMREAVDIYARHGDAASLFLLLDDKVEVFERILRHQPNSPFFPLALQRVLFVTENWTTGSQLVDYTLSTPSELRRLESLCRRAANDPRVTNKAMWRYASACLNDHLGHPAAALKQVEGLHSDDEFLDNSLRILRLHLHAQTDPIDDAYERRLFAELQWLDGLMLREWATLDSAECFRQSHIAGYAYNVDLYRTVYANDALRRIVLRRGGLYDRFRRAGRTSRALQLVNMADNRFLQVSRNRVVEQLRRRDGKGLYDAVIPDAPNYLYAGGWYGQDVVVTDTMPFLDKQVWRHYRYESDGSRDNCHDFGNTLFVCADRLTADVLGDYVGRIVKPADAMDLWFNERSYCDLDYWRDIVGTHLLRERRFEEAGQWLALVDSGYQHRLNVEPYMRYDPFSYQAKHLLADNSNYKLRFASRMAALERTAQQASSADDRADALLNLSIGLRNAFGQLCWPLVAYGSKGMWITRDDSLHYDDPFWEEEWANCMYPADLASIAAGYYAAAAERQAERWRREAFATYVDPERKARALRRVGEFTYLMQHLADTPTGQDIARRCDRWKDYRKK
ncbi:MAG: hypothetical protein IJ745_01210 [Bacteroidales bacterium]|nr:hypothetical protein [Bacteroidales bacterium]